MKLSERMKAEIIKNQKERGVAYDKNMVDIQIMQWANEAAQLEADLARMRGYADSADEVADGLRKENAALKLAVQAAIDYFTDGITSKEQYDAYLRFVDVAQPFFGGEDE